MNLGQKCQDALKLQSYYDIYVNEHDVEPSDEEWCRLSGLGNDVEELRRVMEEGIEAKNRLVVANLRMVQGVVNLYIRNGLGSQYNAGDLMQEGTMALIRAAEKYEPNRGFRFSTYAMYWIRAAVKRSQILQSRMINIPQRHHETHKKVMKVEKELKKEYGRKPSSQEIAESAGISESQLERCVHALSQQCFSLDAQIENKLNPNKSSTRKDTLHDLLDARYDDVEYRQLQQLFLKEDLIGTLKRYLTPREVDILLLRYGLIDEKTLPHGFSGPLTIAEVSRLVGLKPDKVRRMINSCLRQLRHLIAHEWEDFESELPA
jgi:RNA polymerase primary sigma factor